MVEIKFVWWGEETEAIYKLLIHFSKIYSCLAIFSRLIHGIFSPSTYLFEVLIPATLGKVLLTILILNSKNTPTKYKAILSIIYSEYFNTLAMSTSSNGMQAQKGLISILAFLIVVFFEFCVIKNRIFFNIMLIKHIYFWYIHEMISENNDSRITFMSCHLVLVIIIMFNVTHTF